MAFIAPLDILNRSNQHLGAPRASSFGVGSKAAAEGAACYDTLRLVEIQRNLWRFATRRVVLRAIGIDSVTWTPPTWSATTWAVGAVAAYTPTTGPYVGTNVYWQTNAAKTSSNTATPDNDPDWTHYTGPLAIDLYNTGQSGTGTSTYQTGEVVLVPAAYDGGTTYAVNDVVRSSTTWYVSLTASNTGNAVTDTTHWAPWTSQGRGNASYGVTASKSPIPLTYPAGYAVYVSLYNGNQDNPVSATGNWLSLTGTVAALQVKWPLGAGPLHDPTTLNVFRLPNGFLKRAPTDPKAGQTPYLGSYSGASPEDWVLEGVYLVTGDRSGQLMMRFVADIIDVTQMDPMFCEGLGARVASEICETVLQDVQKKSQIDGAYRAAITDARMTNAIEIGPVSQVENRYVLVRA